MEDRTNTFEPLCPTDEGKKTLNKEPLLASPSSTASPYLKRRKVRFGDVRVLISDDVADASGESGDDSKAPAPASLIWYSRQEILESHKEIAKLVNEKRKRTIEQGGCIGGIHHWQDSAANYRGVEDFLSTHARRERKKRKRSVVDNVLQEQARQIALCIIDPERLGRRSKLASKQSRDIARNRGNNDVMAAYSLYCA